jgi:hypothetical protein
VHFGPQPPQPADTLNLFLAEIRQDTTAMAADWADVRDASGVLLGRQPPTRRFDLHYLVTAWSTDEREGELLDAVLAGVIPERRLDPALLTGPLAASPAPVLVRLDDRGAELHRGYGLPPRTVLGLVVNAPLVRPMETGLAPAAEQITVAVGRGVRRPPAPRGSAGWRAARVAEDERPGSTVEAGADATSGKAG